MQKTVCVEKLLHWCYREELPKGYERADEGAGMWSSVSPMFRLADLGTRVDEWSSEPGFPAAMGQPHPDSILVDEEVNRLEEGVGLVWADSRPGLMHDLVDWTRPDDPILSSMSFQPRALVMVHARMGTRPIWDLGKPKVVRVIGRNGKPVVEYEGDDGALIEGRTTGRHYGPGARCPLRLEPEPREIACARAEYQVWHQAITKLTQWLRVVKLHDHVVLPTTAAPEPWIRNPEPKPRILRSLRRVEAFA